jgi:hypothetical protein
MGNKLENDEEKNQLKDFRGFKNKRLFFFYYPFSPLFFKIKYLFQALQKHQVRVDCLVNL